MILTRNRSPRAFLHTVVAFQRLRGNESITAQASQESKAPRQRAAAHQEVSAFARKQQVASAPAIQSFATGGGDRNEIEPNDTIAQGVSLPVNIFGEISVVLDVDYFAFEALAGVDALIAAAIDDQQSPRSADELS